MLLGFTLTFLGYFACHLIPARAENDDKVIQFTAETFPAEVTNSNHFVMFYAPWCVHCQRISPTWQKLAEILNDDPDYQIIIAKVDCIAEDTLCKEHDITGYPTFKFFKIGSSEGVKFRGTTDMTSLTTFINEQLGTSAPEPADSPPLKVNGLTELTESNFDKHVQKGKFFIKFYAPWCSHCQKLAPTWEDLAKSLENHQSVDIAKIDCTVHKSVCDNLNIGGYPTLLWIEDGRVVEKYQGQRTESSLKSFVGRMLGDSEVGDDEMETNEDIVILNSDNFRQGVAHGVSFVKFFAPWCGHCKRLAPTWDELSLNIQGVPNVRLAKVDCTSENSKDICQENEIMGFPTLYLFKDGEKIARYEGSRDIEDLYDFISKYFPHDEL